MNVKKKINSKQFFDAKNYWLELEQMQKNFEVNKLQEISFSHGLVSL